MLPLLFCLQVQAGEAAQVLFANSLIYSGPAADSFTVVVGSVGPPISLGLNVPKNHILYRCWQPWDLKIQTQRKTGAESSFVVSHLCYSVKADRSLKFEVGLACSTGRSARKTQ